MLIRINLAFVGSCPKLRSLILIVSCLVHFLVLEK